MEVYVPCADFMSTSDARRKMTWDKSCRPSRGKQPNRRIRAQHWEIRAVGPALYDHPSDMDDESRGKKRKRSGAPREDQQVSLKNNK